MTSQLLHIPLRRSRSIPLGYSIEQYVEKEFHQNEGQATIDADTLDKLRNKIIDTSPHISSLEQLLEYVKKFFNLIFG